MLTIGSGSSYATLHRSITVTSSGLQLGTVKIAALTTDEQAWLVDLNNQRVTVSFPTSFSNLVIDEYAEEEARAEVAAIQAGTQPYGDATEALFGSYYLTQPGAMYVTAGVADLVPSGSAFLQADANWMAEKANCPSGNWQTCPLAGNTGHYYNISNTANVWIGVGESTNSFTYPPYGNQWPYAAVIIVD